MPEVLQSTTSGQPLVCPPLESISDLAAERMQLQVIEPGCALDVGQRLWPGDLLPFEYLAAANLS